MWRGRTLDKQLRIANGLKGIEPRIEIWILALAPSSFVAGVFTGKEHSDLIGNVAATPRWPVGGLGKSAYLATRSL